MNTAATMIAGAAIFAAGLVAGRMTARDTTTVVPPSQPERHATQPADATAIDEILSRFQQLDDRLNILATPPAVRSPHDSPDSNESLAAVVAELKIKIEGMLADVHLQTSNLAEVARLKPSPDVDALRRLSKELNDDTAKIMLRITGMDYRDATRAFGTPTVKRPKPNSSTKVIEWWWDMPDDGRALMLEFQDGVAAWGGFTSNQGLKQN